MMRQDNGFARSASPTSRRCRESRIAWAQAADTRSGRQGLDGKADRRRSGMTAVGAAGGRAMAVRGRRPKRRSRSMCRCHFGAPPPPPPPPPAPPARTLTPPPPPPPPATSSRPVDRPAAATAPGPASARPGMPPPPPPPPPGSPGTGTTFRIAAISEGALRVGGDDQAAGENQERQPGLSAGGAGRRRSRAS